MEIFHLIILFTTKMSSLDNEVIMTMIDIQPTTGF